MLSRRTIALTLVLVLLLPAWTLISAQQDDGYQESFDDPTLPQWERSREVLVSEGVMRLSPGNFALRFGDWSEITLDIRLRYSGEGEVFINTYFRDESAYGLILAGDMMILERRQGAVGPVHLDTAQTAALRPDVWLDLHITVSNGQHQVSIGDALVLSAADPDPLPPGALMFHALGEIQLEVDQVTLTGLPGGAFGPPPEEPRPEEGQEPPAGEPRPELIDSPAGEASPDTQGDGWAGLLDEFLASQPGNLELATFAINMALAALCASVLSLVYIHWGASLSNRRKFAANFMLLTVTTTFIILVVRSSVALSLGLVGALSIIRFRTAVKEAEELAYLFFSIGLGIGLGDNQRLITLLALVGGVLIIGLLKLLRRSQADVNLHLTVAHRGQGNPGLPALTQALGPHAAKLKLIRFDETADSVEAAFLVEFRHLSQLNDARDALRALAPAAEITFLDNKGVW